jgi:hypothetical protein
MPHSTEQDGQCNDTSPLINAQESSIGYSTVTDHRATKDAQSRKENEGVPKANLKYLIPAFGIGVSLLPTNDDAELLLTALKIFLSALDETIVVSSYGRIGSDLDALSQASWITTS